MPYRSPSPVAVALLSPLVVFAGCTITPSAGGVDASTAPDAAAVDGGPIGSDLGECVEYTPAKLDGSKSGTFASRDDVVKVLLPKTDVGGGLLKLDMKAGVQPFEVGLWLGEGEKADEQRTEFEVGADGQTSFVARLAGGMAYELRLTPLDFRDDKANGYTVAYTYEALVDCYEGNDTRAAAKRIPIDAPVKAHLHAGIGPNDSRLVGPSAEDWYWFELTKPKSVSLSISIPGDNAAFFQLRDSNDLPVACQDPNFAVEMPAAETKETFETCSASLAAGRYWVRAGLGNSEAPSAPTAPTGWREPYVLTVRTR